MKNITKFRKWGPRSGNCNWK